MSKWQPWYSWHPVRVYTDEETATWAWLTWLERRDFVFYAGEWGYEYRFPGPSKTGNEAFDQYTEAEMKRLEDDRVAFAAFVQKLKRQEERAIFSSFQRQDGD